MDLIEALLSSRKYYKTDRNYIFTIDKPSPTRAAVVGGALGTIKGLIGSQAVKFAGDKIGKGLAEKSPLVSKAALKIAKASVTKPGRIGFAAAAIPIGAAIGHAMSKRKLKHADPYVQGILEKVKGEEIKRKQYRSLLKGQQAIGVSAHRLFPSSRAS